jgi:hypothetical protein
VIAVCTSQATRLIQHWNGSIWTLMSLPDPNPANPGMTQSLSSISSDSATDVWAVGLYTIVYAPTRHSLRALLIALERQYVDSGRHAARPGSDGHLVYQFKTIDAISPTNVWAVGQSGDDVGVGGTPTATLIELERHRVERRAQPDGRYVAVPERRDRDERAETCGPPAMTPPPGRLSRGLSP